MLVPTCIAVVELKATVLLPSVTVLTLLLLDDRDPAVTLKFFVSKAPLVTVSMFVPMLRASASSTEPP